MKTFNINNYIYIQITEEGWEHLRKTVGEEYILHCIKSREKIIEKETWYRLQCHSVMDIFPINIGGQPYFNTNIMFELDETEYVSKEVIRKKIAEIEAREEYQRKELQEEYPDLWKNFATQTTSKISVLKSLL